MKYLSTAARILVPAAMVVFLAYEISQSMPVDGWWYWILLIGSFATAIGIEIVGILAGHALEGYWRIGDNTRSTLSALLLTGYTATAVYILRANPAMFLVPIIAAIVYLLSALTDGLETAVSHQAQLKTETSTWEREEQQKDKELERELRRQRQADQTAIKLAKLQQAPTNTRQEVRQESGNLPTDWRQLTPEQKYQLAHLTREEREHQFPHLATRTRRQWHTRLDQVAAQNGTYIGETTP